MLQTIRDKTSGWIAYLIIGLISVPFALWGINSYLGGGEEQPAATVDGEDITPRQLDYAYARYRDRLASVFGGQIPNVFNDEAVLKDQVLTQIIEEQVLQNYIREQGYRVGDKKLLETIRSMPMFQQDGRFNAELYQNQLASQGYTPALFEQELRRSQELEQLNLALKASAFTLPVQAEQFQALQRQTRKLRTLTLPNASDTVEVTEQEINEFYEQQPGRFMEPAQVKVDYIELNLATLKKAVTVSEQQIEDRYQQLREQLTTPEVRTASHILLTAGESDDDAQVKQKAIELKQRIDQGEDFAELARQFSQDPGSAAEGGDLGEVEREMMVKPFEEALFAMSVGEVSEPVKTQFGWHLIKLHQISGGETQSFEQARQQIEEDIRTEIAENQIYDLAESLANIGYEQPDSLLPASEQLGLPIQTTDWFSRSAGTGLAEAEKVRQIAFSDDVLKQNRNSETIELSDNRIVLLHLNSHQPATQKPVESVRDEIIETLKKKKGREQSQQQGQQLLAALKQGQSLQQAADERALNIVDLGFVSRNDSSLDRDVLSAAFTLAKPESGQVVFEGVTELDGDYTIIEFSGLGSSSDGARDGGEQNAIKSLTDSSANYEYQAMIKSLTERADVIRTPVEELQ